MEIIITIYLAGTVFGNIAAGYFLTKGQSATLGNCLGAMTASIFWPVLIAAGAFLAIAALLVSLGAIIASYEAKVRAENSQPEPEDQ